MSQSAENKNWNNEFVKELLWMLKETEDVIDDQLSTEKRKSSMKENIKRVLWANRNSSTQHADVNYKEKLDERKHSILGKIRILVKKRLGYDIDYSDSIFSGDEGDTESKTVYHKIADLCAQLHLPKQLSEYIHLVIFSMNALKYLSDLEYIHRINRGTIFRDRDFKANKFLYMRFKLHRYIMNYALMSFHPFMIRFNKLRATLKQAIDETFYYINIKVDDYVAETKRLWNVTSVDPNMLDEADQEDLKTSYDGCRANLQENCFVWLEKFNANVTGELCPDEFESEEEEDEVPKQENVFSNANANADSEATANNDDVVAQAEDDLENPDPIIEAIQLVVHSMGHAEVLENGRQIAPVFGSFEAAAAATRNWEILRDANQPAVRRDLDAMSQTNSSVSEVFSDGLPSNNLEVASTSGSEDTHTGSFTSNDTEYPRARKMPRIY